MTEPTQIPATKNHETFFDILEHITPQAISDKVRETNLPRKHFQMEVALKLLATYASQTGIKAIRKKSKAECRLIESALIDMEDFPHDPENVDKSHAAYRATLAEAFLSDEHATIEEREKWANWALKP